MVMDPPGSRLQQHANVSEVKRFWKDLVTVQTRVDATVVIGKEHQEASQVGSRAWICD